ncbi:linoleate diol synthase [Russula dissimulans]|nr:linoleate diol synthase [Russula dissimulans]
MSGSTVPPVDDEAAVKEFRAAMAAIDAFKHMNSIDDRKMALEHVVAFLSKHADGVLKDRVHKLQNKLVELLYDDLSHPPATYIGPKYSYRMPDGSYNNLSDPDMGKAREPYARSVQQTHPLPSTCFLMPASSSIPSSGVKRHPAGLSSLMFSFAALVIHKDVNINETSSYVDLAPLYGNDEETLNKIRVRDGRGLLFPDIIAEERILLLPPAVSALLVLFSRNHNYIADKLLEINERGTYTNPDHIALEDPQRVTKLALQDEDIFQTARLINCSWFAGIVFSDYFGCILGLVRQGSAWTLNPFGEIRTSDHKLFERGRGNVCSVEASTAGHFNCLYRWHATTSEADAKWVEQSMARIFPGQSLEDVTIDDFKDAVRRMQTGRPHITQWTFGNLKRGEDGRFKDSDLAAIIKNGIEHPAATFGARGTPHIMKVHEVMGIEANRRWGVCSLNEFRKFLGLKPYSSFLEWNSNSEIAEAAERLYSNIENLELYVGLQAEETKPIVDGAGLCPGYTVTRAILSDAIALTRGDRFFTTDHTPFNLTAWGFADSQRNVKDPGNGSMLGRLLLRSLPREFSENSTYTWFPLQTPESMKVFLGKLGTADRYSFNRPSDAVAIATAREYNDVQQVLGSTQFRQPYGDKALRVISGEGFFLASNDSTESERDQREILRVLQGSPHQAEEIAHFFYERTRRLIILKSYTLSDKGVMFVDVAGLELKWGVKSRGDYTESQLYEMVTDIYSESEAAHRNLQRRIKANVLADAGGMLSVAGLVDTVQSLFCAKAKQQRLTVAERLFENGASADQTTNNVLSLLVGASVELSQSIINVVNYYLDKPDVVRQIRACDPKSPALEGYVYEAMRIDPPFRGVYRESLADQTVGSLALVKGQRVFVDLAHASCDPHVFPDPITVNIYRKPKARYLTGDGVTRSLGVETTTKIMSQVLRAVFEFDGMRRGPGLSGTLKRYKVGEVNTLRHEYLDKDHLPTAWPDTMVLQVSMTFPLNILRGFV